MKKTIQKPENWQDFETLCKQLWGELWSIPTKIKKNGRNGQSQAGIDVYGVPKGSVNYWGIQCKGKDDYANAKLTKKEIEKEIRKAQNFKPDLSVFIFATTMNKDSSVEEYVRIKDLESRKNGGFEILLFCWEDIADLIDDNQDTYNFWVVNKQHKTQFDFEVSLNNFQYEHTIRPHCIRTIKKYRLKETEVEKLDLGITKIFENTAWMKSMEYNKPVFTSIGQDRINKAICSFEVIMRNTGTNVIEDWRVRFNVNGVHKGIMNQIGTRPIDMIGVNAIKHKRTSITGNQISYSPRDNLSLIQKDNRYFKAYIIPECREYMIRIEWELLARDFNSTGIIYLNVEPEYEDKIIYEDVKSKEELKEDEIVSIEEKKNYKD